MTENGRVIWGRKNSINVMKVLWCCEELGLPYERKDVGGAFGGNDTPEYLTMNPNGKVPVLDDNGYILWESNVIVRYLAFTYGNPGLFPEDPQTRFRAEQWMDWMQTAIQPAMWAMFWHLIRFSPEDRDPEQIETSRKASIEVFQMFEEHLENNTYAAGDEFTMGDIPVGAAVHRWFSLPVERPDLKLLKAYYDRLGERPAYQKHIMLPLT